MNKAQSTFALSAVLALAAFVLSWVGCLSCQFVKFAADTSSSLSSSGTNTHTPIALEFGLWRHQALRFDREESGSESGSSGTTALHYTATCRSYPPDDDGPYVDPAWKAARAFSVLAIVAGGAFLVIVVAAGFAARPDPAKAIVGPGFALACLFQGLSLLFLTSDVCRDNDAVREIANGDGGDDDPSSTLGHIAFAESCSISYGAECVIAATVLWFVASIASCLARAAERAEEDEESPTSLPRSNSLREPFMREQSIFARV